MSRKFVMDVPAPMFEPVPMSGWTAAGISRLLLAQITGESDLAAQREAGCLAMVPE